MELTEVPESLVVIGGGYVGMEQALVLLSDQRSQRLVPLVDGPFRHRTRNVPHESWASSEPGPCDELVRWRSIPTLGERRGIAAAPVTD